MKPITFAFLTLALGFGITAGARAGVLYDGSTNTAYMASSSSVTFANPTAGSYTLTSNAANQGAYLFGNFAATTLTSVGDWIQLSFTTTNWPGVASGGDQITPIGFAIGGIATQVTANTTLTGFSNYEGFYRENTVNGAAYNGYSTTNTNMLANGSAITGASGSTLTTQSDRFDSGDTATFTLKITRTASGFDVGGTVNVLGGTGAQSYNLGSYTSGNFATTDDFNTFAIGIKGSGASNQFDSGAVMSFSNISVTTSIPEPAATSLLLGGALAIVFLARRNQKKH